MRCCRINRPGFPVEDGEENSDNLKKFGGVFAVLFDRTLEKSAQPIPSTIPGFPQPVYPTLQYVCHDHAARIPIALLGPSAT